MVTYLVVGALRSALDGMEDDTVVALTFEAW
jgi:hypothetical protein